MIIGCQKEEFYKPTKHFEILESPQDTSFEAIFCDNLEPITMGVVAFSASNSVEDTLQNFFALGDILQYTIVNVGSTLWGTILNVFDINTIGVSPNFLNRGDCYEIIPWRLWPGCYYDSEKDAIVTIGNFDATRKVLGLLPEVHRFFIRISDYQIGDMDIKIGNLIGNISGNGSFILDGIPSSDTLVLTTSTGFVGTIEEIKIFKKGS